MVELYAYLVYSLGSTNISVEMAGTDSSTILVYTWILVVCLAISFEGY